jgi:hypothetical protein
MTLRLSVLAALAAVILLAPTANAGVVRTPVSGEPAFEVNAPDGWPVTRDGDNSLQITAPDRSGWIVVSIRPAPDLPHMSLDDLAAAAFSIAHALPFTRKEPTTLAGLPAEAYFTTAVADGGAAHLRLVVAKVDATHVATVIQALRIDPTEAQAEAIQGLQARVHIVGLLH